MDNTRNTSKTADDYRADAARMRDEARESFERCDTDGFLSQWSSNISASKAELQAHIIENGGKAWFARYRLVHADTGEVVADAKYLPNATYGPCWLIPSVEGKGRFVNAHPKREATMVRKGYREVIEVFEAEATAVIKAEGRGLSGAASARVATVPADSKVKFDLSIGCTDRDGAAGHFEQMFGSERLFSEWVEVRFI